MDLIKIGKYVAGKRKEQEMTQRQLADKLHMSDKSVSKWERGICLPDVSVYFDLCSLLGISINEFLAGEDIVQENIIKKSEENIIGVATDSKRKQKRLKRIIGILVAVLLTVAVAVGIMALWANRPINEIGPIDKESDEQKIAEMISDSGSAYIYPFTTTEKYDSLRVYVSEYRSGVLVNKENCEMGFGGMGSPQNGTILIVPVKRNATAKVILAGGGCQLSTEIPILKDVPEREYYISAATEIQEPMDIKYNEEQNLVAFIYGKEEAHVPEMQALMEEGTDRIAENDYVYLFSFEFRK